MLGNNALQSGIASITASGTTTLGFAPGNTVPKDFITVSAAGAATIALPPIAVGTAIAGIGGNQLMRVMNLAAQSVVFTVSGSDVMVGTAVSTTIAANACATLITNASNSTWYRFGA